MVGWLAELDLMEPGFAAKMAGLEVADLKAVDLQAVDLQAVDLKVAGLEVVDLVEDLGLVADLELKLAVHLLYQGVTPMLELAVLGRC